MLPPAVACSLLLRDVCQDRGWILDFPEEKALGGIQQEAQLGKKITLKINLNTGPGKEGCFEEVSNIQKCEHRLWRAGLMCFGNSHIYDFSDFQVTSQDIAQKLFLSFPPCFK